MGSKKNKNKKSQTKLVPKQVQSLEDGEYIKYIPTILPSPDDNIKKIILTLISIAAWPFWFEEQLLSPKYTWCMKARYNFSPHYFRILDIVRYNPESASCLIHSALPKIKK